MTTGGPEPVAARSHPIDYQHYVEKQLRPIAEPVLAHRITVKPEMWMSEITGRTVVDAVLASVPAPSPLEPASGDS